MRFVLRFFGFLFSIGAIALPDRRRVAAYFYWKYSQDLPDHAELANYEPPVMTRVHAGDGSLLAEYARERRLYMPIQAVPKRVIGAFLSAEDKNFYKHSGIDPEGIVRAALTNFKRRQAPAGRLDHHPAGRQELPARQRADLERKIREAMIAFRIEQAFSKDRILELYLNEIYLGLGSYGVAAAALNYFDKSVHELTLAGGRLPRRAAEGAEQLPSVPQDERARRRNWVIDRMVENGYITREEADKAKAEPLGVNPRVISPNTIASGYFAEEVRREIAERYGEKKLYEGGLSVRTTLDPKLQAIARKACCDGLVRYDEARGWRGAQQKIDSPARMGLALAEVPALGDVQPWRLAVVLEVGAGRRGSACSRRASVGPDRARARLGAIGADGIAGPGATVNRRARGGRRRLCRAARRQGRPVPAAPDPRGLRRAGRHGPAYRPRARAWSAASPSTRASSTARRRRCASRARRSSPSSTRRRSTTATRRPSIVDAPITIDMGRGQEPGRRRTTTASRPGRDAALRHRAIENLMTVRLAKDIGMPLVAEYAAASASTTTCCRCCRCRSAPARPP